MKVIAGKSQIDDRGVLHLAKLPRLEHLEIPGTRVTDAVCEYLSQAHLKKLDLGGTMVSDIGISTLHCEGLESLQLAGTDVSARPFVSSGRWPSLKWLTLGTGTSSEEDLECVLENPMLEQLLTKAPASEEFRKRHRKRFSDLVGHVYVRGETPKSGKEIPEVAPRQP